MLIVRRLSVLLLSLLLTAMSVASESTVRLPLLAEQLEGRFFYMDVTHEALRRMPDYNELEMTGPIPQVRAQNMLESGTLDIMWMIENPDRDQRYLPTRVGLTRGMIGERVLMIRPEDQELFDDVEDLADFRSLNLTAGFGRGWIDSQVWAANELDYFVEQGNWQVMFSKLARGRTDFDYLSRSIKEVQAELAENPELTLEYRLLLRYARDEVFYVSPHRPELHRAFSEALQDMEADGTLDHLVDLHFGHIFSDLEVDQRTVIELRSP
ncbi:MAG: transporter substrate-binding domain-containing protein [Natronospirillum sp.]|uniref:substrate-binding periplasmic protein n=1 Tax=Natronospirillum sp. TaxID=2812955 RepID=UPI0025CC5678|nr:transporter substrate-binding domain-containing protein [Natronospirillum sp.]MCH8552432.1 transporter substrate-binding domain-containing protein [Natronospirillum sp.]